MRKMIVVLAAAVCLSAVAYAGSGNPTSNVLYDTAATATTLVMRDANGAIDGAQLIAASVVTAKISAGVVDTSKLNFVTPANVSSGKIVCVMGGNGQQLGVCANGITAAACTCQ